MVESNGKLMGSHFSSFPNASPVLYAVDDDYDNNNCGKYTLYPSLYYFCQWNLNPVTGY